MLGLSITKISLRLHFPRSNTYFPAPVQWWIFAGAAFVCSARVRYGPRPVAGRVWAETGVFQQRLRFASCEIKTGSRKHHSVYKDTAAIPLDTKILWRINQHLLTGVMGKHKRTSTSFLSRADGKGGRSAGLAKAWWRFAWEWHSEQGWDC